MVSSFIFAFFAASLPCLLRRSLAQLADTVYFYIMVIV